MTAEASTPPILIIETGVHRGARAELMPGRSRIGATPDNEIVLSDIEPAGTCFAMECGPRAVVLHAIEGPITLANGKSIPPGNSTSFDKSARFTCGGIAFHLHASNAVSPRLEIRAPFKAVVASSAGVLALLALAVTLHAASPSSATLSNSSEITGSLAASVGHTKTVSIHEPSLMLPSLQRLLKDKGLDTVVLTTRADGAIEARGLILPQQKAAWQEIGHWFDSWAAGRTVLVDSVSVSVEEQPLALQSVWPGPNPYVIDGSGGKLFVGSVLANGWTISSIERTRVLMRRGDQTIAVKF